MPATEQIHELFDTLLSKTRQQVLRWKPSAEDDTFRLEFKTANLRLSRSTRWDAEAEREIATLKLTVIDGLIRIVEEYRPETPEETERLEELYVLARRSALQTENVLDKLLLELQTTQK